MSAAGLKVSGTSHSSLWAPRVGVFLLFLGAVMNLFDRQVINVLAQDIKVEMHLSDTALGLLTGTVFGLFFALMGIPAGRLADKMDRAKLLTFMIVLWSISTVTCGLATNYFMLALSRMGVGLGEGGAQPGSAALVADFAVPARRSSALSLMYAGVPIGTLLGYFVGGLVAHAWGWRAAFIVVGVPGFLVAALVYIFVRDPRAQRPTATPRFEGSMFAAVSQVARMPRMGWLAVGMSASGFSGYATNAWIPAFFIRTHGMTVAQIGLYGALATGVGGTIGVAGVGPLCDWLRKRIDHPEAWVMVVATALGVPWLLLMVLAPYDWLALFAFAMFQVFAFVWLAPITRLVQDAAGPTHRALAVAYCGTVGMIFTLCIGVPAVGLVSDLIAPVTGAWSIGYALCLFPPFVALLGVEAYRRVLLQLQMQSEGTARHPT